MGRRGRRQAATGWPQGNNRMLEIERGSTRSHSVGNSLLKRPWTCCKTNNRMNGIFWICGYTTVRKYAQIHSAICIIVNNSGDNSNHMSIINLMLIISVSAVFTDMQIQTEGN